MREKWININVWGSRTDLDSLHVGSGEEELGINPGFVAWARWISTSEMEKTGQ